MSGTTSADQMDAAMAASINAFPAKTAGIGAQTLEPVVLPDGTRKFDLTAADNSVGGVAGKNRAGMDV